MAIISHGSVQTQGRFEFSRSILLTHAPGDRCFPLLCSGPPIIDMDHLPGFWVTVTPAAPPRFQHSVVMVPWTAHETRAEPLRNAGSRKAPVVPLTPAGFLHPISICHFSMWLHGAELLWEWGAIPSLQFRVLPRGGGSVLPSP